MTTKKGTAGKMRVNASAAMFVTTRPDLGKLNLMNASEKVDFELGMAANPNLTYQTDRGAVSRILTAVSYTHLTRLHVSCSTLHSIIY